MAGYEVQVSYRARRDVARPVERTADERVLILAVGNVGGGVDMYCGSLGASTDKEHILMGWPGGDRQTFKYVDRVEPDYIGDRLRVC